MCFKILLLSVLYKYITIVRVIRIFLMSYIIKKDVLIKVYRKSKEYCNKGAY